MLIFRHICACTTLTMLIFRPANEIFKDPNAFDFLSQHGHGSTSAAALARESLYTKFDPLIAGRASIMPPRVSHHGSPQVKKHSGDLYTEYLNTRNIWINWTFWSLDFKRFVIQMAGLCAMSYVLDQPFEYVRLGLKILTIALIL